MALDVFSIFRKYPFRFSSLAVIGVLLTATSTHAGFEWVPAPKAQPEAMPSAIPAPPASVEEMPMPEQLLSPMPDAQVLVAPAPAEPVLKTKTFIEQAPLKDNERAAPAAIAPPPAPQQEEIIFTEPAPAPMPVAPTPVAAQENIAPLNQGTPQEAAKAQVSLEINPDPLNMRVVMPEDAPESARNVMPQDNAPVSLPPAENVPAPEAISEPITMPAAPAQDFAVIEGFGNAMPLALALKEIVPEGYAYSFGTGVNPGAPVSWNGGKAWPDVINDMIAPLGLSSRMNGTTLLIRADNQSALSPQGAPNVEPASGKNPAVQTVAATNEYSVRRQSVNDPGSKPAEQPASTLDMARELGLNASAQEPENNAVSLENAAPQDETVSLNNLESATGPTSEPIQIAVKDLPSDDGLVSPQKDENPIWEAQKGDSLKSILDEWSKKARYELVWESSHDFTIDSDVLVTGDFQRAVKAVFAQGIKTQSAPLMTFINQAEGESAGKIIIQNGSAG